MTHRMIVAAALAACATASGAHAQALTGTWKGDVASAQLPTKPDVFAIRKGVFTCTPAVTVPADGRFHRVSGHPYWDEIKVSVVSPVSVAYDYRFKGQDMSHSVDTVSADGRTLTTTRHENAAANAAGAVIDGSATQTRVAPAPAGSHATSGSWRTVKVAQPSNDAPVTITLADSTERLMLKAGTGEHFDAAYGGAPVPVIGDRANTMAAVRRIDARTVEETDTRAGKVVATYRYVLQPDGRTITMTYTDTRDGKVTRVNLLKQ